MRRILLAAVVAVAAAQAAPAAHAACAETHGGQAHLHSGQCGPNSTIFIQCPVGTIQVTNDIGFACD